MARADMFFKATGKRTGDIAGESKDKRFAGQIEVIEWSWGMTAPAAIDGQATGRVQAKALRLVKRADKASTALMSVMRNNELLSKATLSVRKGGGQDPVPYMTLVMNNTRVTAFDVASGRDESGAPVLVETLMLTFETLEVEYLEQSETGGRLGSSTALIDTQIAR